MSLNQLFQSVREIRDRVSVDAAFGKPIQAEGRMLIPVAQVRMGMGLGFGESQPTDQPSAESSADLLTGDSGGGGAGGGARPIALIEISPEHTEIKPIVDQGKLTIAGILLGMWVAFWLAVTLIAIFGKQEQ